MIEVEVKDREVIALMNDHYAQGDETFVHTNLKVGYCACDPLNDPNIARAAPIQAGLPDGGVCFKCGGMTVRTGTCTTCTSCGEAGGCG